MPGVLASNWESLAKLKDSGFSWQMNDLKNLSRNSFGCDLELCSHAAALDALLVLAPSGFPSYKDVRDALLQLHHHHGILNCSCENIGKIAVKAADVFRVLCRQLYNRRREGHVTTNLKVQELVARIVLAKSKVAPATPDALVTSSSLRALRVRG